MQLTDLAGVGDALAARLVTAFGTEEAALAAVRDRDVERLAAVEGLGERRAVDLVLAASGRRAGDFLRTPRAEALYEDVLDRIRAYANTDAARGRLGLLVPLATRKEMEAHLDEVADWAAEAARLPRDATRALLAKVGRPRTPRPKFDSGLAILVDGEAEYEKLVKAGLDRHCRLLTPEDSGFQEAEMVVYAYTTGSLDLTGADHVVPVPFTTHVGDLVPEATLAWFRENRALWDAAARLAASRVRDTVLPDVLAILDRLDAKSVDFAPVEAAVRRAASEMNDEVKTRAASLSLAGDEILAMMSGRPPKRLTQIQADVMRSGRERVLRETGEDPSCFTDGFPVQIDEDALEKAREAYVGRRRRALFRERVDAARRLAALRPQVEEEVRELLDFDYRYAVGCFVLDYKLARPKFGDAWRLAGALHLNLAAPGARGDAVDYELAAPHRVALLTGANSGGKTTLLETLAQVAILAHMGLPVPAREATVQVVEAVYFFTQKRSLDAGAFEGFLKGFVPIVTSKARKLVLADELEAMTELEAASRIVGTFIEMLKESGSSGVCVTHMADEVSRYTSVRIDGIEARGLDENLNLVVDRTPRMGYRARSTPELILRRLLAKADGAEKGVYEAILKKF